LATLAEPGHAARMTKQKYVVCALGIAKSVTAATIAEAVDLAFPGLDDPSSLRVVLKGRKGPSAGPQKPR
jgi:hypothetical protein